MSNTPDDLVVGLTVDIVAAYLHNNPVDAADLPALVRSVYAGLLATSAPIEPETPALEPAVPVKRSVFPDAIVCLDCGARMSILKRHLAAEHGLSPNEYRSRWGLPHTYPMVAPNYAQRRSEMAKSSGLGRLPSTSPVTVEGVVVQQIPAAKRGRPRKA